MFHYTSVDQVLETLGYLCRFGFCVLDCLVCAALRRKRTYILGKKVSPKNQTVKERKDENDMEIVEVLLTEKASAMSVVDDDAAETCIFSNNRYYQEDLLSVSSRSYARKFLYVQLVYHK